MILYLPEPFEFPVAEDKSDEVLVFKIPSGGHIEAQSVGNNQVRVTRLISTDPMDYMNQKFQPGCLLELEANLD